MKWIIFLIACCSIECGAATIVFDFFGATPSTLNNGLVSYYQLEEADGLTRVDSEPTGTAQNLTDNNTVTQVTGQIGNAAFFTQANGEYLSHVDSADLSSVRAINGWFLGTNFVVNGTVASKWSVSPSAQRSWRLWFHSAIGKMAFEVSSDGTATTEIAATTFGLPTTNVWHMISAWINTTANTLNISIDNGTVNTTAYAGGIFTSTAQFDVGARGAGSDSWGGAIDELGLWDRPLTASELTELYALGVGKQCACPFAPP